MTKRFSFGWYIRGFRFSPINCPDDFFDLRLFHRQVNDRETGTDIGNERGGRSLEAIEGKPLLPSLTLCKRCIGRGEIRHLFLELNDELPLFAIFRADLLQAAIIDDASVIDDHDARANLFDICHVVGGEMDGHFLVAVDLFDELTQLLFRYYVYANHWFV